MPHLSLGRGEFDEYDVNDFTAAAYQGDTHLLSKLLKENPEHKKSDLSFYFALRGGKLEAFKFLLESGIEFPGILYAYALFENPEFLKLLPENTEQMKFAEAKQFTFRLYDGLAKGRISANEIRELVFHGADARGGLLSANENEYFPVHIAALHPDLKVMKELMRAGVEPKMMAPNGKNAVRMVYENRKIGPRVRKDFVKYFRHMKREPIPALSATEKILLWLGLAIPSKISPPATLSSGSHSS